MGGVRPAWWACVGLALTVGAVLVAYAAGVRTHALTTRPAPVPHDPRNLIGFWCAAPYAGYALLGLLTLRHPPAAAGLLAATLESAGFGVWLYAIGGGSLLSGGLHHLFLPLLQWVGVVVAGVVVVTLLVAEDHVFQALSVEADGPGGSPEG
jgi:hypothetical protein